MVFIGGWRTRRPTYGRYPYGGRGYGYGNDSCLRDLCLIQSGCCLAQSMGCGPELTLLAPSLVRRSFRAARLAGPEELPEELSTGRSAHAVRVLQAAIRLYQEEIGAKRRRSVCRYSPSCSRYAAQALEQHGLRRGLWLAARRLLRCRPGTSGGSDPVPPARDRWC